MITNVLLLQLNDQDKSNFLFLWAVIQVLMTFIVIVANFTGPQPTSVLKVMSLKVKN